MRERLDTKTSSARGRGDGVDGATRRAILRQPLAPALAILVAWAPLPFASVTPGFAAILQVAALLLLGLSPWLPGGGTSVRGAALAVPLALAGVAALGVAQSLPWPIALVERLSPEHARYARESAALAGAPEPVQASL